MTHDVDPALDGGLNALRAAGQTGEVYVEDHSVYAVAVSGGRVESVESQEVRGAAFRIFSGGRVSCAYTADISADGLREAVGMSASLLPRCDPDDANQLPEADSSSSAEPEIFDPLLMRMEVQDKIRAARRMEESARAFDARVTRVRQSRYTDVAGRVGVASTSGLRRSWPFTRAYGSIELMAEQGSEKQSGWFSEFSIRQGGLDMAQVGREAARRAVAKLGAERTGTRRASLVLDPLVTASLLEALAPALHGDNVLKGKSLLGPRLGADVGGARLTLMDDGRLEGGDRSAPWDAEGVATRCTLLIEGGVLKGFLHSSYTSVRMSSAPTGNAFRASFTTPPRIAPSTLYLQPTGQTAQSLMAEAGDGILVTEVMGLHTIDTISGDFSLGAAGNLIKGGHPDRPVDRIGIAGNLLGLLRAVVGVGTDMKLMPGGGAGSTVLLRDVSVSGT